jgi:glucose 1-dehydrogenase
MNKPLEGQTAIVTGASSGIGAAVARELGRMGAGVCVNYRSDEKGAFHTIARINELGSYALPVQADVSDPEQVGHLFSKTLDKFETLDILVNNAGIQKDASFRKMSSDDWQKVINVNLTGQFLCSKQAVEIFCSQRVREGVSKAAGKIVCMSSVHEEIPWAGHVNYAAAKGGVQMFMKSLAQEVAHEKIRVNGVAPGAIATDINREVWESEEGRKKMLELIPYGRIGEPEDVGRAVGWLVSDEADYLIGTTLFVDGGMMLYPGFREGG